MSADESPDAVTASERYGFAAVVTLELAIVGWLAIEFAHYLGWLP